MKKKTLAFAALFLCVAALSACGGKTAETEPETTVAETEAETEAVEEEEPEEDSLIGTATGINDNIVTVLSMDDGNEYRFDISEAEIIRQYPLSEGDEVYVEYYVSNLNPKTATIYEVEEPYLASTMDPYLDGTVTAVADDESVTIETDDGNEYTFYTFDAYIVTESGIEPGTVVEITYIGEPDDEPYAIKIVSEECFGTAAAEKNGFVGVVAEIYEDQIVLLSGDEDYFTFVSDSLDFEGYDEGDRVLIIYEGLITEKEIPALEISLY